MDSSKRRVGRPKTPPRTGPLVLENDRSREAVEVQINSETARELAEYAAWVESSGALTTADATFKTVEYALREVFRRDRVWQDWRRTRERQKGVEASVKAESVPQPVARPIAHPVSLPPPVSPGATRVGPDRPL
jgi:hypothetical protein